MKKRQTPVLAVLARARPARLDPDAATAARWPTVDQLIEAARLADDEPVHELGPGWPETWPRRRPPVPAKLLGALTSAAVMVVVIVLAVVVGTVVFRAPHGRPTGILSNSASPATSLSQPPVSPPVFRSLALGPDWRGHLAYAVSNGVVYLSGVATLDSAGTQSGLVTTLPRSARPAGRIDLVAIVSDRAGTVEIGADGRIEVIRQQASVTWVSLSGASFPVGSR